MRLPCQGENININYIVDNCQQEFISTYADCICKQKKRMSMDKVVQNKYKFHFIRKSTCVKTYIWNATDANSRKLINS